MCSAWALQPMCWSSFYRRLYPEWSRSLTLDLCGSWLLHWTPFGSVVHRQAFSIAVIPLLTVFRSVFWPCLWPSCFLPLLVFSFRVLVVPRLLGLVVGVWTSLQGQHSFFSSEFIPYCLVVELSGLQFGWSCEFVEPPRSAFRGMKIS